MVESYHPMDGHSDSSPGTNHQIVRLSTTCPRAATASGTSALLAVKSTIRLHCNAAQLRCRGTTNQLRVDSEASGNDAQRKYTPAAGTVVFDHKDGRPNITGAPIACLVGVPVLSWVALACLSASDRWPAALLALTLRRKLRHGRSTTEYGLSGPTRRQTFVHTCSWATPPLAPRARDRSIVTTALRAARALGAPAPMELQRCPKRDLEPRARRQAQAKQHPRSDGTPPCMHRTVLGSGQHLRPSQPVNSRPGVGLHPAAGRRPPQLRGLCGRGCGPIGRNPSQLAEVL